jgi:hypothetical protein
MLQFHLFTFRLLNLGILQFDSIVLSLSGVAIPRTGMATPRMMLATSKTVALFCECIATCQFSVAIFSLSLSVDVPGVRQFGVFYYGILNCAKGTREYLFPIPL